MPDSASLTAAMASTTGAPTEGLSQLLELARASAATDAAFRKAIEAGRGGLHASTEFEVRNGEGWEDEFLRYPTVDLRLNALAALKADRQADRQVVDKAKALFGTTWKAGCRWARRVCRFERLTELGAPRVFLEAEIGLIHQAAEQAA